MCQGIQLVVTLLDSSDHALVLLRVVLIAQVVRSVPFFVPHNSALAAAELASSAQWGTAAAASTVSLNRLRAQGTAATEIGDRVLTNPRAPVQNRALIVRGAAGNGWYIAGGTRRPSGTRRRGRSW